MQKDVARTDAFLMAAKRTFLDFGYDTVSMDEVAEAAGTTKRTLYNHFGSKERLFEAVVHFVAHLSAANLQDPAQLADEPKEAIIQFCLRHAYWSGFADAVALHRIVIALAPRFPQYAKLLYTEAIAPAEKLLAAYVTAHLTPETVALFGTADEFARSLLHVTSGERRYFALLGIVPPYPMPKNATPFADLPEEARIRHLVALYVTNR